MNVAVVRGCLSRPPQARELPSGDLVASLEVTVPADGKDRAQSVPISVNDPAAWLLALDEGAEVVVVGQVRRRFFRAGKRTESRTEVVATSVVVARQAKRVATVLERARRSLEATD